MIDQRKIGYWIMLQLLVSSMSMGQENYFPNQAERKAAAASYYETGNIASQRDQYQLAILYFDSALRLYTGYADYYFARGQMKELTQDYVGALIDYEIVVKKEPKNHVAVFKRALIYHKQNKFKQAAQDFTALINEEATFETKAVVFKSASFDEKGLFVSTGIATMNDMLADVYLARALTYQALGFVTPTKIDFNKTIELNDRMPDFYVSRGLFYMDQKDEKRAEEDFRKALEIHATHRLALYNLLFLVDEEEKDQINRLLYNQGDFGMAYSKRAFDNYQKGKYKEALLDYDSALLLKKDDANDLMNRGMVKMKLEVYAEAIKDFETSVYADNSLTRNFVLIANAYQKLTNYTEAIDHYKKYLLSDNGDGVVYYNLGLAYMNDGDPTQACQALKQALVMGETRAESALNKVCFAK